MTRTVEVGAARLPRWVEGFAERHREVTWAPQECGLVLRAADGATASLLDPWGGGAVAIAPGDEATAAARALADRVAAPRRVAVVLVRRGGYACAVVDGGVITASKVGSRYVQGRTAAGGWSQQRFARRRENQTAGLAGAAADVAVRLLLEPLPGALATGGDRPLVERVLADPRLRALAALPRGPHLQVGEPRSDVVRALPDLLTRVPITLEE